MACTRQQPSVRKCVAHEGVFRSFYKISFDEVFFGKYVLSRLRTLVSDNAFVVARADVQSVSLLEIEGQVILSHAHG